MPTPSKPSPSDRLIPPGAIRHTMPFSSISQLKDGPDGSKARPQPSTSAADEIAEKLRRSGDTSRIIQGATEGGRLEAPETSQSTTAPEKRESRQAAAKAKSPKSNLKDSLLARLTGGDKSSEDNADDGNDADKGGEDTEEPSAPSLTAEDLANLAASAGARAAAAVAKEIVPHGRRSSDSQQEDDWPDQYKADAPIYEQLAKNPKYSGIKQKLIAADKAEQAYIEKWRNENPGVEFDPEAEDHATFYDSIGVDIPERDLKAAERQYIIEQSEGQALAKLRQERERQDAPKEVERVSKEAVSRAGTAVLSIIQAMDDSLKLDGASQEEVRESIQQWEQDNKVKAWALNKFAPSLIDQITQARLLTEGRAQYNPSNPSHASMAEAIQRAEASIQKLPQAKRIRVVGGSARRYASPTEFASMQPAEQARHWTIGVGEIESELTNMALEKVLEMSDELEKVVGIAGKTTPTQRDHEAQQQRSQRSTASTSGGSLGSRSTKLSGKSGQSDGGSSAVDAFLSGIGIRR